MLHLSNQGLIRAKVIHRMNTNGKRAATITFDNFSGQDVVYQGQTGPSGEVSTVSQPAIGEAIGNDQYFYWRFDFAQSPRSLSTTINLSTSGAHFSITLHINERAQLELTADGPESIVGAVLKSAKNTGADGFNIEFFGG